MFEMIENEANGANIKVVGVGGGGGNAVQHMIDQKVGGVEFICANTDSQALKSMSAEVILQLGGELTKGLGAGARPEIGRDAAIEDREHIAEVLEGADMVFVTAGMGGGTGTGAAPIVAEVAKDLGILTVAVVTRPFSFEGKKRMQLAEEGIRELAEHVDSLITIPNEKLMSELGATTSLLDAFKIANDVLLGAVQGIANLVINPGLINVDFSDVRTVMSEMGMAMMGSGAAIGESRAREAAESAMRSRLLEDVNMNGAKGILVNITASDNISIGEFTEVGNTIHSMASSDAIVVLGTVIDETVGDELRVTVVATGLESAGKPSGHSVVSSINNRAPQQPAQTAAAPVAGLNRRQEVDAVAGLNASHHNDYSAYDAPAVDRSRADRSARAAAQAGGATNREYLNVPTFLRQQAD